MFCCKNMIVKALQVLIFCDNYIFKCYSCTFELTLERNQYSTMYVSLGESFISLRPSWSLSYGSWISNYLCNQCLSPLTLCVRILHRSDVLDTAVCYKVCLTEILLKVVLNTINQPLSESFISLIFKLFKVDLRIQNFTTGAINAPGYGNSRPFSHKTLEHEFPTCTLQISPITTLYIMNTLF